VVLIRSPIPENGEPYPWIGRVAKVGKATIKLNWLEEISARKWKINNLMATVNWNTEKQMPTSTYKDVMDLYSKISYD
jgi:hypothetical protein